MFVDASLRSVFKKKTNKTDVCVCVCAAAEWLCVLFVTFSDVTMSEGARWFPKQSVSLTEGPSVKENSWMNLPMTGGWQRGWRG